MDIAKLRNGVDEIDRKIVELLNRRCKLVLEIGKLKQQAHLPIYVPEREQQLLEKLTALNPGPLEAGSLTAIYREIMSAAIRLEKPLSVACLGPAGTFSHQAVVEKFGHGVEMQVLPEISDVFAAVESGRADYGMVPVENSQEGVVNPSLDALIASSVEVIGEFSLPVHLCLFAQQPADRVRCVYSHLQVFGQCRSYLQAAFPGVQHIEVTSTAKAVELMLRDPESAAVAGKLAGELHGLRPAAEQIEDNENNVTRFFILGRQKNAPTGRDRTSFGFVLRDQPGALYQALAPFVKRNVTLKMIESRPRRGGSWEYCFFVDILGHREDAAVAEAFAELQTMTVFFKVFGSYPQTQKKEEEENAAAR